MNFGPFILIRSRSSTKDCPSPQKYVKLVIKDEEAPDTAIDFKALVAALIRKRQRCKKKSQARVDEEKSLFNKLVESSDIDNCAAVDSVKASLCAGRV